MGLPEASFPISTVVCFHAWDGLGSSTTRMKDHLDPLGTEPLFIEGIDGEGFQPGCGSGQYQSVRLR